MEIESSATSSPQQIKIHELEKLCEALTGQEDDVSTNSCRASAEKSTNSIQLDSSIFDAISPDQHTAVEKVVQQKPDFRTKKKIDLEQQIESDNHTGSICSLCTAFVDKVDDIEDKYEIGPDVKIFSCMRCNFVLCQICTQQLASNVTLNAANKRRKNNIRLQELQQQQTTRIDLILNKCPKCQTICARRPWYPSILHALSSPLDFVGSQLLLPNETKKYGPYLVVVDSIIDENFDVKNTLQCTLCKLATL